MIGLAMVYDKQQNKTIVTISYPQNTDAEYFILEYYDEVLKKWVPYDGKYGIVKKE